MKKRNQCHNKTNKIYYSPPRSPFRLNVKKTAPKTLKHCKSQKKMFNKILFIIVYFNIAIPLIFIFMEDLRFWIFYHFPPLNTREKILLIIVIISHFDCLFASTQSIKTFHIIGSSVRSLSSQHSGLYPRQRVQSEELADNTQTRSVNIGLVAVRAQSQEGATDGTSDQESTGAEAIHLPGRRRIPRVSFLFKIFFFVSFLINCFVYVFNAFQFWEIFYFLFIFLSLIMATEILCCLIQTDL